MRSLLILVLMLIAAPVLAQSPDEQLAAASALIDAGRYAQAAQNLEAFVAKNPRHTRVGAAWLALGRCHTEQKAYVKAVTAYERAAASGDEAVVPVARLGLGEAAMQSSQWEKAIAALSVAVRDGLSLEQAVLATYWLGQANFQLKQYAEAEQAYLRVAEKLGKNEFVSSAWYGAGITALRQGRADVAKQRLRLVADRYRTSEERPMALVALAQIELEAKRYREARAGFEAVLAESRLDPALRIEAEAGLVQVLMDQQDYRGASERLQGTLSRLPAQDPQRSAVLLTLGHCRYRQKEYEPALEAYREAARGADADRAAEALYWAGNSAMALGKNPDAATLFGQLVTKYPKHALAPKAQLRAGDAHQAAKQTQLASAAYRKVVQAYPQSAEAAEAKKALSEVFDTADDPAKLAATLKTAAPAEKQRGLLRLARLHLAAKKYPAAETTLQELLKTKPTGEAAAEGRYLLGLAYEAQKKAAPAAASLSSAVKSSPAATWGADAWTRLAWLYVELKQPASAQQAASSALALKPAEELSRQALLARVQAQIDQKQWDGALADCRQLADGNPPADTLVTVLYTQAWVNEQSGKPAEALPLWERLVREQPKSIYAAEGLVRLGDARFEAKEYEPAAERYRTVLEQHAGSAVAAEARYKLGSALYHLERHADAAAEWDRVAQEKGAATWTADSLFWAGTAYDKTGKKTEAIDRLSRLVTGFPKHELTAKAKVRLAALKAVAE